jgi:hypothetical protein
MKEITKEDLAKFEYIIKLTKADKKDVQIMQYLMTTYVDNKSHVCGHCHAQIKHAHRRLSSHYSKYNEQVKIAEISNDNQPDIRECRGCGEDISNLKKTIKYCNDCRIDKK